MSETIKKVTPQSLMKMKEEKTKITMMTAYDYPTAALIDRAGIDMILVGDSLGSVIQGRDSTLSVTLEAMIYHTEMVARASQRALVVADLPFPYAQLGADDALRASVQILKQTRASAVKIEGGEKRATVIQRLTNAGIPVMGHCGLMPQDIRRLGGYKVQRDSKALEQDILAVADAGAMAIVLECVPQEIAAHLTEISPVPTIGIGAGFACDGQVIVFHDMLGLCAPETRIPKHARRYAQLGQIIIDAAQSYIQDVRIGAFPSENESFH